MMGRLERRGVKDMRIGPVSFSIVGLTRTQEGLKRGGMELPDFQLQEVDSNPGGFETKWPISIGGNARRSTRTQEGLKPMGG